MQEVMEASTGYPISLVWGSHPQNTHPDCCWGVGFWMNTTGESQPFPGASYPIMMNVGLQIIHTDPGS